MRGEEQQMETHRPIAVAVSKRERAAGAHKERKTHTQANPSGRPERLVAQKAVAREACVRVSQPGSGWRSRRA